MHRIVPAQPLPLETIERVNDIAFGNCELILDDDVNGGVEPLVGKRDPVLLVIGLNQRHAIALVQRQPGGDIGRLVRIVLGHCRSMWDRAAAIALDNHRPARASQPAPRDQACPLISRLRSVSDRC